MKLGNCTMHDQTEYLDAFAALGYEVDPKPLLREVSGPQDALVAALDAIDKAKSAGAEGILLGGRTDLCIYAALFAVTAGLAVFIAETRRERDTEGNFRFNLAGVTPLSLEYPFACRQSYMAQYAAAIQEEVEL